MRHHHVHFISTVLALSAAMASQANPLPPSPVSLIYMGAHAMIRFAGEM